MRKNQHGLMNQGHSETLWVLLFPESSFLRLHKLCLTNNMSPGFQEQHLMYKAPVLFFLHYLFGLFTFPPFLLSL